MDSFLQAVIDEPERFLSYIRNWDNILTLSDFLEEFNKAFGFHYTGSNVYKSTHFQEAMKRLWEDNYTQSVVRKNRKKYEEREKAKFISGGEGITKFPKKKDYSGVNKDITVTTKKGSYKRSYRKWSDREEQWLKDNSKSPISIIVELFNILFKNRTESSLSAKRRRLNKK